MVFPGGRVKSLEFQSMQKKSAKFSEISRNNKSRGLTSKTRFPGHGGRYNAF